MRTSVLYKLSNILCPDVVDLNLVYKCQQDVEDRDLFLE